MKKKIAVLACSWSAEYVQDFIKGMRTAIKGTDTDIYLFNGYDYTEFSGYPNINGYSVYSLINYEDFDGAIVLSDLIKSERILEKERRRILQAGIPAVSINSTLKGLSCVKIDNFTSMYELVNHLIKEHGIRKFAYISGKEDSSDIHERYRAFSAALKDNGIQISSDKIFMVDYCNYNSAYNAGNDIFKNKEDLPQAVVCATDLLAFGVMKRAEENNIKIPDQVKISAYDNCRNAKYVYPSLTSVNSSIDIAGAEAVKKILSSDKSVQTITVKSSPVYRASCGCPGDFTDEQKKYVLGTINNEGLHHEFNAHMEVMEEIFTQAKDVYTLMTNLDLFFQHSHFFEGPDFCVFLKSDWTSVLINTQGRLPSNLSYGNQVQSITSIQNNEKYLREIINTKDLIPEKMRTPGDNFFLFMPIFHHSYVHGYFVTKNNTNILINNYAYTWIKSFGNSIERFRKQNMYKQLSQEYLKLSTQDSLSGLLNRVGLEKIAKPFYSENKKEGLTSVLFFVDINDMKFINDNFGHLHGDLAVKTIASAIKEVIPKNWLAIRFGGDEFLVVGNSKNYTGEDYSQIISKRIAEKTSIMRLPYTLTASIGSYSVPSVSNLSLEEALGKCDEIMYKVKEEYHKKSR